MIQENKRGTSRQPGGMTEGHNWQTYLIALPVILYFFIFHYLPMFGVTMAFQDFRPTKGFLGSPWVGFQNFIDFLWGPLLADPEKHPGDSFLGLAVGFSASILFALLLEEIDCLGFKKTVQTISYLPILYPPLLSAAW